MVFVSPSHISRRVTSIGQQARAGDVAGFGTRQVSDEAGDLVWMAIALEGDVGDAVPGRVGVRRVHVGVNHAGLNVVDGDAARPEVPGESLRKTGDRALGECID